MVGERLEPARLVGCGQMPQQQQAGLVGPLEIVEYGDDGLAGRGVGEEPMTAANSR